MPDPGLFLLPYSAPPRSHFRLRPACHPGAAGVRSASVVALAAVLCASTAEGDAGHVVGTVAAAAEHDPSCVFRPQVPVRGGVLALGALTAVGLTKLALSGALVLPVLLCCWGNGWRACAVLLEVLLAAAAAACYALPAGY